MTTGFGRDTWCLDSLQPGRLVSGAALLAQALYRRWTTPRGTLRGGVEESVYGIDVVGFVGAVSTPIAVGALPSMMRAEGLKDDRVAELRIVASASEDSNRLTTITLKIRVTPADETQAFDFTMGVSAVTAQILGGLPT